MYTEAYILTTTKWCNMKSNKQHGNANETVLLVLTLMILSGLVVGLFTTGHWIAATLILSHIAAIIIVGIPVGVALAGT